MAQHKGLWPLIAWRAGGHPAIEGRAGRPLLSLVLLIAFWDTGLVIGIGIDAVLLTIAVTRPAWAGRLAT